MACSWSHAQFRKDFSDEGRRSMTCTVAPGRSHEFVWAASGSKRSAGLRNWTKGCGCYDCGLQTPLTADTGPAFARLWVYRRCSWLRVAWRHIWRACPHATSSEIAVFPSSVALT